LLQVGSVHISEVAARLVEAARSVRQDLQYQPWLMGTPSNLRTCASANPFVFAPDVKLSMFAFEIRREFKPVNPKTGTHRN
jgi:hypothetical protein